jgi:UDP-N-acetylmuramate--alanine ligase
MADAYGLNITMHNGGYEFDVGTKDWMLDNIKLNMGGMHNVENAVAAIMIAHHLNIQPGKIKDAVNDFRGVKRRFEYIIGPSVSRGKEHSNTTHTGVIFIDDYAHHPQELDALISGAKSLFPGRKCTIIFQPHLFSRTRDFADEFAEVLNRADDVYLLPIYPARELPIENVRSEMIAERMEAQKGVCCNKEELIRVLSDRKLYGDDLELLITAGAGDIDTLIAPIKQILESKN